MVRRGPVEVVVDGASCHGPQRTSP
jgi:hypothetical protein